MIVENKFKRYLGLFDSSIDAMFLKCVNKYDLPIFVYFQLNDIKELDCQIKDFHLFVAIFFLMHKSSMTGSTCIEFGSKELHTELYELLNTNDIQKRLDDFFKEMTDPKNIKLFNNKRGASLFIYKKVSHKRYLYTNKNFDLEISVAEILNEILTSDDSIELKLFEQLKLELNQMNIIASDEQLRALNVVASKRLSVITGGPGSGKTFLLGFILYYFILNGYKEEDIAIAAPTGKAANRIKESLNAFYNSNTGLLPKEFQRIEPKTIHRLLSISNYDNLPFYNKNNKMNFKLLIIDESSMIDLNLMKHLLKGIDFKVTKLIFVGDQNQLPSISSGNLLQDLIEFVPDKNKVNLTKCFRSEKILFESFEYIKNNNSQKFLNMLIGISNLDEVDFNSTNLYKLEMDLNIDGAFFNQTLNHWLLDILFENIKSEEYLCEKEFTDERINQIILEINWCKLITNTNIGPFGVDEINSKCLKILREKYKQHEQFLPNFCPIMVLKNDYKRSLFNGDQGVIINTNGRSKAYFNIDQAVKSFYLDDIAEYTPSFVITVHKSQGSEYEHLIYISSNIDNESLNNNPLIYTALTRCKKNVIILGNLSTLTTGLNRKLIRTTGIKNLIE